LYMTGAKPKKIAGSCLILAGGQGKRLTPDKPLLEINRKSIIERITAVRTKPGFGDLTSAPLGQYSSILRP